MSWVWRRADRLAIVEVRHDPGMQARVREAWDKFWPSYIERIALDRLGDGKFKFKDMTRRSS